MNATHVTNEPRTARRPPGAGERMRKILPACLILYAAIPLAVSLRTRS
jgi:hypothetical protein